MNHKLKLPKSKTEITRYPMICNNLLETIKIWDASMNQSPDYAVSSGVWYAIYPDGREECVCPTGEIKDLGADIDGETEIERSIRILGHK